MSRHRAANAAVATIQPRATVDAVTSGRRAVGARDGPWGGMRWEHSAGRGVPGAGRKPVKRAPGSDYLLRLMSPLPLSRQTLGRCRARSWFAGSVVLSCALASVLVSAPAHAQ